MICMIAVLAWLVGLLQPIDNWLGDQRFRVASRAPTGDVVLVSDRRADSRLARRLAIAAE